MTIEFDRRERFQLMQLIFADPKSELAAMLATITPGLVVLDTLELDDDQLKQVKAMLMNHHHAVKFALREHFGVEEPITNMMPTDSDDTASVLVLRRYGDAYELHRIPITDSEPALHSLLAANQSEHGELCDGSRACDQRAAQATETKNGNRMTNDDQTTSALTTKRRSHGIRTVSNVGGL